MARLSTSWRNMEIGKKRINNSAFVSIPLSIAIQHNSSQVFQNLVEMHLKGWKGRSVTLRTRKKETENCIGEVFLITLCYLHSITVNKQLEKQITTKVLTFAQLVFLSHFVKIQRQQIKCFYYILHYFFQISCEQIGFLIKQ